MKLTYWVASCLDDSKVYNLRAKTRKALVELRDFSVKNGGQFGPPKKVSIEYRDAFDLAVECLCEGGGYWE